MSGGLRTQGTHLYFVDRGPSAAALVKMYCPTGITGVNSGARDQIEDTCLDATADKTYIAGLGNPEQITVPFILKPSDASHQKLFDLKESGEMVNWIALLSESADAPTLDSAENIEAPATRSSFKFDGYVADVTIEIATNEVVRGTLLIQRSGPVVPFWFEA